MKQKIDDFALWIICTVVGGAIGGLLYAGLAHGQSGEPYGQEVQNAIRVLLVYDEERGEFRYCELLRQAQVPLRGTGCFYFVGTWTSTATDNIN